MSDSKMSLANQSVLITGINGFIGCNLSPKLHAAKYDVWGTTLNSPDKKTLLCDLKNYYTVLDVIEKVNPDIIIHLAALSSVTAGKTMQYYEENVLGTENLFTAINKLGRRRRIIFFSTAGVYGNQAIEVLTEDLAPLPVSHYGISKYVCERLAAGMIDGHDITIFRPFNIIGFGQQADFLLPKLVRHFVDREPVVRLGSLDPIRDYIDVATCCDIVLAVLNQKQAFGQTINLCSGRGTSVRELLTMLCELTAHEINVVTVQEFVRKNEVWKLLGSTAKLNKFLPSNYQLIPLKQVLNGMLADAGFVFR
jgi:GDP-6-deoxy-D-talose 4-dehydrogenase